MTPRSSAPRVSDSRDTGAYGGEFNMSDAEFQRVADKVFEIAGIVLKDHKRQMVYTRLSRRLRALGMTSFTDYMDHLESGAGSREITEFSNAVTTNLTSFFRESHHFDHLRHEVLEPLGKAGKSRIRVWSAGCSTGEEPYSIALTARAAARSMGGADFRILATDLDTNVLAKAKAGIYPEARAADVPSELRSGAMSRRGADVEMSAQLKSMIAFRQLNLLHAWPFRGPFDVIFCRNVLIYFDAETKAGLVRRYAEALTDDGILYLGHSESLLGEHPLLSSEGRTIYRRRR
ncbi:chemotaxis protein methyltransferase CheR [Albimonas donghaensis]|uniref:Chemotaxis protein methyltransferase n=1 Tax=Albimonas donghaensis TaxID=356660 RepID=A0A1H2XAB4_9RHOB|nr:protein-glutamate O-methyltransferase CheR [Albimonas donghaensis]SDW89394.1 chemotaxis protein methyltransferase CheR [Albimonas donghaensis]